MRLNITEGYYEPSYFFMKIETNDSLDIDLLKHQQTFTHEFIHFLQDIFLPYNIRMNLNELNKFANIANKIKIHGIKKPYLDPREEAIEAEKILTFTWGGNGFISEDTDITSLTPESFTITGTSINVYKYNAELSNGKQYAVGARDMLEYIAHKIESKYWTVEAPAFPYRTMDKVLDHLELSSMPDECKIALIEYSLHNDNPFHHLLQTVKFIKAQGLQINLLEINSIYALLKNYQWNSAGGFSENIDSKIQRRLAEIKTALNERFYGGNFSSISMWVDDVINFASLEITGKLFFSDIYRMEEQDFFDEITRLIEIIGVPLIFNNKEECISLLSEKYDNNQFIQFYAAFNFMEFIKKEHGTCPMCGFCENSNEDIMDNNCFENAVTRGISDLLCPFGQLIKTYELHNIT